MNDPRPGEDEAQHARRALVRQAVCVAGAFAAGAWPLHAATGDVRRYGRTRLVDEFQRPISARQLRVGEPWLFNYPYAASPVFLLALESAPAGAELTTEARQRYAAPAGVGPRRSVVAFSAICAHKLMYPTPQISFIGVRRGFDGEPAHVIHCCGDQSRYDPAQGARVIGGPAPQPLAAVLLDWDSRRDELHATGVQGGEMFQAFFEKYAFRLEMELGRKARDLAGPTAVARPASAYSRQWQSCRA
ncbi:MAG TPA: (2Fe-2S)-binding protein [Burkholderiaceae bacterium]|nr:(2Fe-2S)-binding protein [Burkholderiaceae bacterium]